MTHPKKSLKRTLFCTNLLLASFACHLSAFAGVAGRGVDPSVLEANASGPGAYTDGASALTATPISGALNGAPTGPSAWDGYVACVTGDALIRSRQTGKPEDIVLPEKPEMYQ